MYPYERSLVKKLADKPFALIGVNCDENLEKIRQVVKDQDITWRSFWNGEKGTDGPIASKWNINGLPTIYVLDAEGKIRFKNIHGERLDEALTKLLAEMDVDADLIDEPEQGESDGGPKPD